MDIQNDAELHYNRGVSLQKSKRFNEAEKEFREAIEINPKYVEAIHDLGVSLANLKRYEEAENEWRKALIINPYFSPAIENLNKIVLINGHRYTKDVVSKGLLFFIKTFWAFILSFLLLWWAGLIYMEVHFSEPLTVLWYTLKFILVFLIVLYCGYCAIKNPRRYVITRRSGSNIDMYNKPVVSVLLIIILIGAFVEGIFGGSQAALGGAIGAGLVGLNGILGMFIGRAINSFRHLSAVVVKGIEWSMIFSAFTVADIAFFVSTQDHVWFFWIPHALSYVGGEFGALGAMVAGALIMGACLASWMFIDRFARK
jgi:hypothetical protein